MVGLFHFNWLAIGNLILSPYMLVACMGSSITSYIHLCKKNEQFIPPQDVSKLSKNVLWSRQKLLNDRMWSKITSMHSKVPSIYDGINTFIVYRVSDLVMVLLEVMKLMVIFLMTNKSKSRQYCRDQLGCDTWKYWAPDCTPIWQLAMDSSNIESIPKTWTTTRNKKKW